MDVPRQGVSTRRNLRRTLLALTLVSGLGGAAWGVGKLQPALPSIDAASVWPGTVKRGPMVRQVHGTGSLVPQEVVWISAQIDGRIEKINLQPGAAVRADTVVMQLSNPTLNEAMVSAEFDLKQAQALYADLDATLKNAKFDKQSAAAQVAADYEQAKIKAERDEQLGKFGLIAATDLKLSLAQARDLERRNKIEEDRLRIVDDDAAAQLAAQRVKIDQFKAIFDLKKEQVAELTVRAGVDGILQQLGSSSTAAAATGAAPLLEAGQNVAAGAILARIAQQDKLKAQIRVSETEAKDIALGQPAEIDTHNGVAAGRVARIDPSAVNGSVLVDVALTGALPPGARPDLSVDGTVEIERLADVVYVGRPASGQPNSTVTLFCIDAGGKTATHRKVRFGRASVNTIEVLDGLKPGDTVILSDTSTVDAHDRIRLE